MKRLMYVLFFVLLTSGMAYAQQAKYVFYFIGDGMGVNQANASWSGCACRPRAVTPRARRVCRPTTRC